MKLKNEKK